MKHGMLERIGKIILFVFIFAAFLSFAADARQRNAGDRTVQAENAAPTTLLRPARVFDTEEGKTHEG
jgi:hypothetical protein